MGKEVSSDDIIIELSDTQGNSKPISWNYGVDVSQGSVVRKNTLPFTDPNLSFEVAGPPEFQFKVGQKIGMAVYRNYEFDFSNENMWTDNNWDKNELTQEAIMKLFGPDVSASIYTGEIIRVSKDGQVIEHDINTYKGCSGAIIFLLDKNQDELVDRGDYGKAIAIHAGSTNDESTVYGTDGKQKEAKVTEKSNIGFSLRHLIGAVASGGSPV